MKINSKKSNQPVVEYVQVKLDRLVNLWEKQSTPQLNHEINRLQSLLKNGQKYDVPF